MHGLGDTGEGWQDVAAQLNSVLPEVKFVLPTAPTMPVTLNMGMAMPSWYDIKGLSERSNETCDGIEESRQRIVALLEAEKGTPKVILAGFSQGGALALYTGLQYTGQLAGIAALSSYLPCPQLLQGKTDGQKDVPILICHGTIDQVVRPEWSAASRKQLTALGHEFAYHEFRMGHEFVPDEFRTFTAWLKKIVA
ncbi:Acyl-protein thioesterase 1 [Diplonema papillatum]|nr:Acyl-protein thioesterase 1 [Diplonema papillatum]